MYTPGRPDATEFPREVIVIEQEPWASFESSDPIVGMLLRGEASSVHEAEEKYLDAHLHEVIKLVGSVQSDEEFRRHPLISMLLAHGSRGFEDSLL
jgi:hypothetical protein